MCLALFRPASVKMAPAMIAREALENAYISNSDSFGFMYALDGKLFMWKSIDPKMFDFFLNTIMVIQESNVPLAVHFRVATHGENDTVNAHPIPVIPGKIGIIHNGIISAEAEAKSAFSDTFHFAKRLRNLPRKWHRNIFLVRLLEDYIGDGNKVVVLTNRGESVILNEAEGHWSEGIWYSNHSYKYSAYKWLGGNEAWMDEYSWCPKGKGKWIPTRFADKGDAWEEETSTVSAKDFLPSDVAGAFLSTKSLVCIDCIDDALQLDEGAIVDCVLMRGEIKGKCECELCGRDMGDKDMPKLVEIVGKAPKMLPTTLSSGGLVWDVSRREYVPSVGAVERKALAVVSSAVIAEEKEVSVCSD